eukprot:gene6772-biopygen6817
MVDKPSGADSARSMGMVDKPSGADSARSMGMAGKPSEDMPSSMLVGGWRARGKASWRSSDAAEEHANGLTHVVYDDGDEEDLNMSKEKFEAIPAAIQHMQGAPRGKGTMGDYRPKARAFMQFCEDQQRQWQPATEATMRLYIAHLMDKGTVLAASLQPYLSAINNYHEDMGHPGPAKGRIVARAVKGMSSMQVQAAKRAGEDQTVRKGGHCSAHNTYEDGCNNVCPYGHWVFCWSECATWEEVAQLSSAVQRYTDPTMYNYFG